MSLFFTRPPPRLPRTGEDFLAPASSGHNFLNDLLTNLDENGKHALESFVRNPKNELHNDMSHDDASRNKITKYHDYLMRLHHVENSRSHQAQMNTGEIANTIEMAMDGIKRKFHLNDGDHGKLIRYEIRDGFAPLDRLVLLPLMICPPCQFCQTEDSDHVLLTAYKAAAEPLAQVIKWILLLGAALFFVFSMLCLSYSQQSLDLCKGQTPADLDFNFTDAQTHRALGCKELIESCTMKNLNNMTLSFYYGFRTFMYLVGILPVLILALSPTVLSKNMLRPLVDVGDDECCCTPNHTGFLSRVFALCDPFNHDAGRVFEMAANIAFWTHCLFGIGTLVMDGSVISYFADLRKDCHGIAGRIIGLGDGDCACAALFSGADARGVIKVSSIELVSPYSLAILLLFQNMLFTFWGFLFVFQTWNMRSTHIVPHTQRQPKYHPVEEAAAPEPMHGKTIEMFDGSARKLSLAPSRHASTMHYDDDSGNPSPYRSAPSVDTGKVDSMPPAHFMSRHSSSSGSNPH
jgi:hypothetical protein